MQTTCAWLILPVIDCFDPHKFKESIVEFDFFKELHVCHLLLVRSYLSFFKSDKLIAASVVVHVCIALAFGFLLGTEPVSAGSITSFLG